MKKVLFLLMITAFCCLSKSTFAQIQTGENVAVTNTESGKVRGYIHNNIFIYKGIPYAEATRFMPPTKPKPWSHVRAHWFMALLLPCLTQPRTCKMKVNLFFTTIGALLTKIVCV